MWDEMKQIEGVDDLNTSSLVFPAIVMDMVTGNGW